MATSCSLQTQELIYVAGLGAVILINMCTSSLLIAMVCYMFRRPNIYLKEEETLESKRSMAELLISGRQGEYDEKERLKFRSPLTAHHDSFRQVLVNPLRESIEELSLEPVREEPVREEPVREEPVSEEPVRTDVKIEEIKDETIEEFKYLMTDKDFPTVWREFEKTFENQFVELTTQDLLGVRSGEEQKAINDKMHKVSEVFKKLNKRQQDEVKFKMKKYFKLRPWVDPYDSEYKSLVDDINNTLIDFSTSTRSKHQPGGVVFANFYLTQKDIEKQRRDLERYLERSQDKGKVAKKKYSDTKNTYLKAQAILDIFDETTTQSTTITEFEFNF